MKSTWRRRWLPLLLLCLVVLAASDGVHRWYASTVHSVEIVVVNDSEQAIPFVTVSLPPESVQINNLQPGDVVTRYVPRVDPLSGWEPNQTGMLADGTRIVGNGINSGSGVPPARVVYIIRKDGTSYGLFQGGR